ncbi:ParB N-terminal domain-containing protein (plasmid) [Pseudoduganella sp. UC29_106]|uniref:ParB/RepB/Spo0J family partition protein n=1 Tax=Pseudoduganella sp. UC29_106 TaxID=3374553 RepID=UPI003758244F
MSQATVYPVGQVVTLRFKNIVRSNQFNVRSKREKESEKYQKGIRSLAPLIKAEGLMQNLVGFQQKKNKKFIDKVEICAGGRRTDAIEWLIATGQIDPETFEIRVLICSVEEAIQKSLVENSEREPLPPADQYRAFQAMKDAGRSVEEIATAWGVDDITINRRLKLANVAPRLFALYEDDKATLDQLMALALTDDHATQEQVWDSLSGWNQRTHANIRRLITTQAIDTKNSPIARFVGVADYEAAGGAVTRDLFSDNDDGFMNDAALLESLAVKKLEKQTPDLKAKFAWVDYLTSYNQYDSDFEEAHATALPFTDEQQKVYDELDAKVTDLQTKVDAMYDSEADEFTDEEQAELDSLEKEIEALEAQQEAMTQYGYDDAVKPLLGAVVSIDRDGSWPCLRA